MQIPIILNTKKLVINTGPEETLLTILRKQKKYSVKTGCTKGICGSCTVLLDGKIVPSCKIPIGIIRNSEVITLDYFIKTEDFKDIQQGFDKANIKLCGFCNAGKIFSAYDCIQINHQLNREEIYHSIEHLSFCCVDPDTLINGIIYAKNFREDRLRKRKNARN